MPSPNVNRRIVMFSVKNYAPEAVAFFKYLSPQPSTAQKKLYNGVINELIANNIWSKLDRLWLLRCEQQQNARVSLVNPSATAITEVNNPTWGQNSGYTGNGSTSYLDTNYNPATDGVNWALNSASAGIYCETNIAQATTIVTIGAINGASLGTAIVPRDNFSDRQLGRINDGTVVSAITTPITSSVGLSSTVRNTSTNFNNYKNGVIGGAATSTASLVSLPLFLLAYNSNGTPAGHSTHRISVSYCGDGSFNQLTFYTIIKNYLDSL